MYFLGIHSLYCYVVLLFNICIPRMESSQMTQCNNLELNKPKILGSLNVMKVWFGSEISVTCCIKINKKVAYSNDYLEDELEVTSNKESEPLLWFDPNMKPIINYFADPLEAQNNGVFSLPEMLQKSNNIKMVHLVIKNLSSSNTGMYKCDTSPSSHQEANIKFEGYQKIIIDAEQHQFLEEGNPGQIICKPRGHNNIDVVWFYEGNHISPDNHNFSFLKKHTILRLSKVTEGIAGKYICKAEVSFSDQRENSNQDQFIEIQPIEVTVYVEPVLFNKSPLIINNFINEGLIDGYLELACEAMGLPPPVIIWYKNKESLISTLDSRVQITESYYGRNVYSKLKILPIEIGDIGTYTCNASINYKNFMRSVAKNVTPELVFQPRFLSVLTNLNASFDVGKNATLNCTVFGASLKRILLSFEQHAFNNITYTYDELSRNPRYIFSKYQDPKNSYISHYELKIVDIQPKDAGWYNCKASLKFRNIYSISNNGIFSVFYRPIVTTNKSSVYGLWFKKNTLQCHSKGYPNPNWEWKFHDYLLPMQFNQYEIFVSNKNDSSISELIILPNYLNDAIFGSYRCIAKNVLGFDTADILFLQAWQPGPPIVEVCRVTSSSIQLCISQNNDTGGLPLSHYELRIKESDITQYIGPFYYPVIPSSITLSHLKSNMKYKFALSAVSEAGRGINSYVEVETKPLSRPLIELVNTSVSPAWNAYYLRWVVDTDGGLPIVKYDAEIQQVRVDLQTRKIIERIGPVRNYVINDIGQLKHMFRVNSLNPNTYYELKFWAENLMGPSPIQEVVFRTLELPSVLAGSSRLRDPFGTARPLFNTSFKYLVSFGILLSFLIKTLS